MSKLFTVIALSSLLFHSCAQSPSREIKKEIKQPFTRFRFQLTDYLANNKDLYNEAIQDWDKYKQQMSDKIKEFEEQEHKKKPSHENQK